MTTNTIDAIAARLTALGYSVTRCGRSLAIYDTLVFWVWPDGADVSEHRPTMLIDHGGDEDHKPWRWELRSFCGKPVWLSAVERERADAGDAVLAHLHPPRELMRVVRRSPADISLTEDPAPAHPDPRRPDWWTAWHSLTARPQLIAAAVRRGRVDRWWSLIRAGEMMAPPPYPMS